MLLHGGDEYWGRGNSFGTLAGNKQKNEKGRDRKNISPNFQGEQYF
jgi:hypothetical protein